MLYLIYSSFFLSVGATASGAADANAVKRMRKREREQRKQKEVGWEHIHTILTLKRVLRLGFAPSTPAQLAEL